MTSPSPLSPGKPVAPPTMRASMRVAASVVGHSTRLRAANAVARAVLRLVGAPRAVVFLDPAAIRALEVVPSPPVRQPDTLVVAASAGRPSLHVGTTHRFVGSLMGEAVRQRGPVSSTGHSGSAGVPEDIASPWPGLPDAVAVPLVHARRTIGVLVAGHDTSTGTGRVFRQALSDFAPVAAAGLVAASRYEEAQRQVITDPLTGLLNRTGFDRRLREELDRDHRAAMATGALVMMDLDHFKHVNDTWGHLVGDAVVRTIARHAIRAQVRSYDVPCRVGGDEFAVILPHTDLQHAVTVAERIRQAVLDAPTDTVGVPRGTVGASLGVVSFVAGGVGPDDILARADRIMYRAKRRGRNLVLTDSAV